MTTADTTTGQLVLDAEQAKDYDKFVRYRAVVDEKGYVGTSTSLTLTFDVEPQPEHEQMQCCDSDPAWGYWFGDEWYVEGDPDLNEHILCSWWRRPMGNTGEPRVGQRVELYVPWGDTHSTLRCVATVTLATAPRVEQEFDPMVWTAPRVGRFTINVEVTP